MLFRSVLDVLPLLFCIYNPGFRRFVKVGRLGADHIADKVLPHATVFVESPGTLRQLERVLAGYFVLQRNSPLEGALVVDMFKGV